MWETLKTPKKKRTERHYQDVAQKVQHDKNSDTFAAHFARHFDRKPTPQQCREITKFENLSKVNPIGSMKTWSKSSRTLCMKGRLWIVSRSRRRYVELINACSEICGACRNNPRFHRFSRHWWSSQGERGSFFLRIRIKEWSENGKKFLFEFFIFLI